MHLIKVPMRKCISYQFPLTFQKLEPMMMILGIFNAKIRTENHRYIHRLIYQLNEQDLLCRSI